MFLFLFSILCSGKGSTAHEALNLYVDFVNKSIHGMFMVNHILVEYNMVNKYVDLESERINNYSNKDLPKDILKIPDKWFYDISLMNWLRVPKK